MKDRARLRLQRLNTYKCRSTDLTHHLLDGETKPLNLEGKKLLLFVHQETFWVQTKLSYLFEKALKKNVLLPEQGPLTLRLHHFQLERWNVEKWVA